MLDTPCFSAILALEMPKRKQKWHLKGDFPGLRAFKEDYQEAQVCLLYRGKERIKIKGILCVPCTEFLKDLIPHQSIRL
jgi:hypothetical protein